MNQALGDVIFHFSAQSPSCNWRGGWGGWVAGACVDPCLLHTAPGPEGQAAGGNGQGCYFCWPRRWLSGELMPILRAGGQGAGSGHRPVGTPPRDSEMETAVRWESVWVRQPPQPTAASLRMFAIVRTPTPHDLDASHCRMLSVFDGRGAAPAPIGGCLVTHGIHFYHLWKI